MKKEKLKKLFDSHGFTFFENGIYNLNLFGVRTMNSKPNKFDDIICLALYTENGWYTCAFPSTTDAGLSVLGDEMGNSKGTAVLPASTLDGSGQYKFKVGSHKSKYAALNQAEEFTIVRDKNKDYKQLSRNEIQEFLYDGVTDTGWFGINIHHASNYGVSKQVDNWSYGCQVVQSIHDWEKIKSIVRRGVEIYGSKITYTLFDEVDIINTVGLCINDFYVAMNDNREL